MRINTSLSGGFQLNLFLHKICFRLTIVFFSDNPLFLALLQNLKYILVLVQILAKKQEQKA